jgi:hypothetical protein
MIDGRRRWRVTLLCIGAILLALSIGCGRKSAQGVGPATPVKGQGRTVKVTPATFQTALMSAQPGDTLLLADGEYSGGQTRVPYRINQSTKSGAPTITTTTQGVGFAVRCSGESGRAITIRAEAKAAVLSGPLGLSGTKYIVVDGLRLTGGYMGAISATDAEHIEVRNCVVCDAPDRYSMYFSNIRNCTIENNEIYGARTGHGICVFGDSRNVTIRGNHVHDCGGCGVYFDAYTNPGKRISNILVESNVIARVGKAGGAALNVSNVVDSTFRNNLLYKNEAGGMCFYQDDPSASDKRPQPQGIVAKVTAFFHDRPDYCARNGVVSNTVYFEPDHGLWCLRVSDKAPDFFVHNNIFIGGRYGVVSIGPQAFDGLSMDHNVIAAYKEQLVLGDSFTEDGRESFSYTIDQWHAKGLDRRSKIGVDALFVSIPKDDYHLSPKSPAIDAGADVGSKCPSDIDGVKRPQGKDYDCGAYEFVGSVRPGTSK